MIGYFVILIILFRDPSSDGSPSTASIVASSFVAGIYEDFLNRDELRFLGPVFAFYALAAGLPLCSELRFPSLRADAEAELSIMNITLGELLKRWGSASGVIKALATATATIERKPPLSTPIRHLAPSARPFFSDFGPELCRQWHLTGVEAGLDSVTASSLSPAQMRSSQMGDLPTLHRLGSDQIAPSLAQQPPSMFAGDQDLNGLNVFDEYDPLECLLLGDNVIDFSF